MNLSKAAAIDPYKKFKKMFIVDTTGDFKGKFEPQKNLYTYFCFQDYDSELKLRYVRIYFYATTFDRITKDRAAKFVDMLSAIGGTMGLLTGFSIISGVEIVYFLFKIIKKILQNTFMTTLPIKESRKVVGNQD